MCRWAAYRGDPIYLEQLVASPAHSLIEQSQSASEAKTATNGDGFGIAWYGNRAKPGLYRDILPAWADCNLRSLVHQMQSPLFLAHVRASTGGATNRDNCHPFLYKNWTFMHNGQIGHFDRLRRYIENRLSDHFYQHRQGTTDSELLFLLALEFGLETDAIGSMSRALGFIQDTADGLGLQPHIRFTSAFSDGLTLYAIRYATDDRAPTLYAAPMNDETGYCLVSEPFDDEATDWQEVEAGYVVRLDGDGLQTRPFNTVTTAHRALIA